MNTKNNQRYKDTEALIQKILLELAQTTDIRQVTVSSICSKAAINRSTFYAHYLDINDLVDKMGKAMMRDIARLFETASNPIDFFISTPLLAKLISYVKERRDFFDIYLNHYRQRAEEAFSLLWENSAKPYIQSLGVSDEAEIWYHFTFFKAGFLAILRQWLNNGCPESPEVLSWIILRRFRPFNPPN
ncbi:MAG: TetR family transcriptional regulator C-terminal domain-containing protein [Clostridium sp.]|nr:TetR family transcriptional regulator C-terminal domain-containing protein [Clostridium sp.]